MKTIKNILCTILVSILIPCTCLAGKTSKKNGAKKQNSAQQVEQRTNQAANMKKNTSRKASPKKNQPNQPKVPKKKVPKKKGNKAASTDTSVNSSPQKKSHVHTQPVTQISSMADFLKIVDAAPTPVREKLIKDLRTKKKAKFVDKNGNEQYLEVSPGSSVVNDIRESYTQIIQEKKAREKAEKAQQKQLSKEQSPNKNDNPSAGRQILDDLDEPQNKKKSGDGVADIRTDMNNESTVRKIQNEDVNQNEPIAEKSSSRGKDKKKVVFKDRAPGQQDASQQQRRVHPWVQQAQQLAANMRRNGALLAAQNNLPGVYRNDVFEQTNILRQNAHVVHEIMKDSAQRGVNLKAGYLKHKQSVARGLGYDADTFLLAGTLSSGPVNVWGDQTCTFALTAAYTDTSADYKGKYIKSKKEKNCSKEKTFFFGPYVAYNLDRLNINASFLYGHTKYETSRALPKDVALTTWSRKNNISYNGDSMHGNVTLSYTWTFANFHVQPQLGVQYDHVVQKSHNLKIDNNTMAIRKQKLDFVSPFAGIRVSADVNLPEGKQSLVPYVFVGVSRDVHRHASVANKNVLNSNPVTTIVYPGNRDMLITAAGVQWKSDWPVTLDLEYRGVFSGHRRSHEVLGGLGYSF